MFGAIAGGIASALAGGAMSKLFGGGDRKSGSAGMPRPISYAVFCLKKKKIKQNALRFDLHHYLGLYTEHGSVTICVVFLARVPMHDCHYHRFYSLFDL